MEPTPLTDEELAELTDEERAALGLPEDDETTTGAPDAPTSSSSASTKKRRVNDGPTGRARRAEADPGA